METLLKRITINPEICNGKPVIRNMRITVNTVLEYLAAGESWLFRSDYASHFGQNVPV